jgi:flagella basal body P-ring formation protein FlgA
MHTSAALFVVSVLFALPISADTLVARHTIRAQTILVDSDVRIVSDEVPGALTHPLDVVGMETRVVLYADRPIRPGDIGPPSLVDRNQLVTLIFRQQGLNIATEARALGRGSEGDRIRVMNLSSRTTVSGRIDAAGRVVASSPGDLLLGLESN